MTEEIKKAGEVDPFLSNPAPESGGDGPSGQEQEQKIAAQQAESEPPADLAALKKKAEDRIDAFMVKVGYNPPDRTDEAGWRYFSLGSAEGRAGAIEVEGNIFLRVEALVMPMPSDKELILPLMRELLALNLSLSGPARLGIKDDQVYAALLYPVKALHDDDYATMIHWTMTLSDQLDDGLIKKFGGTTIQRVD
jgi:hypothetical protein